MTYDASDPDDDQVIEADVDNESTTTGQAAIGPVIGATTSVSWDRPETLQSDTTVTVAADGSGDYTTIQDALAEVPRRLYANNTIEVDETGDYSTEDVVVPPVQSEDLLDTTEGGNSRLTITRQGTSGKVEANSWFIIGGRGQGSIVPLHCSAQGVNPFDDEDAVFAVYGGEGVKFSSCSITGTARSAGSSGFLSYHSDIKLEGTLDWGTDLVDVAGSTKQGGDIFVPRSATLNGSVTDHAWEAPTGTIQHGRQGPTSTNTFASDPQRNRGIVSHLLPMVDWDGNLVDVINIRSDGDLRIADSAEKERITAFDPDNFDLVRITAADGSTQITDFNGDQTVEPGSQDLTASGAPAPSSSGLLARHDGSGTPGEGLYESDSGNNQWVGIGTRSGTTIAY